MRCLKLLKGSVHIAIQTCGYCSKEIFEQALTLADYFLYDIKLVDPEMHKRYTGVSNEMILQNYKTLCKSGKSFVTRTPLIPGVTDTNENITAIAKLLQENEIDYIELLPYNKVAGGKYASVGRVYTPDFDETAEVDPKTELFAEYNIQTKLM